MAVDLSIGSLFVGRRAKPSRLGGRLVCRALLFGAVSIQSYVILENSILFCKLSCFLLGDSFEVSPEVIV
jgi:hypothetical protein